MRYVSLMMTSENRLIKGCSYARNTLCHAIVANGKNWYFFHLKTVYLSQTDVHIQTLTMVGIIFFQTESHSPKKVMSVKELLLRTFLNVPHRHRQNFARLEPN